MFSELLRERLRGIVELSPGQSAALEAHYELLVKWNRKLNLTSIKDLEEVVTRHYGESVFLGAHLPEGRLRIVDIGSGAGFPGFPVAVLRPECAVTLVEAHQRKAVFLREVSRHLPNVRVVGLRAEEFENGTGGLVRPSGPPAKSVDPFDWAISRAVSYYDLAPILKKMAAHADLLTGGEAPPEAIGFAWEGPIPVPWGRERFLRRGCRIE